MSDNATFGTGDFNIHIKRNINSCLITFLDIEKTHTQNTYIAILNLNKYLQFACLSLRPISSRQTLGESMTEVNDLLK